MTDALRFGILPTPIHGAETPYARQLAEHRELVVAAEALGFDHMVCGQHFLGTELRYYQPVPYLHNNIWEAPLMVRLFAAVLTQSQGSGHRPGRHARDVRQNGSLLRLALLGHPGRVERGHVQ